MKNMCKQNKMNMKGYNLGSIRQVVSAEHVIFYHSCGFLLLLKLYWTFLIFENSFFILVAFLCCIIGFLAGHS